MLVAAHYYSEVPYESGWHRAVVVYVEEPNRLSLRYIDFGTDAFNVDLSTCRWLHERFGRLPAQAIPAILAGLGAE